MTQRWYYAVEQRSVPNGTALVPWRVWRFLSKYSRGGWVLDRVWHGQRYSAYSGDPLVRAARAHGRWRLEKRLCTDTAYADVEVTAERAARGLGSEEVS